MAVAKAGTKATKRLILNPGSSSRKYGLYAGTEPILTLHFEFEDGAIVCTVERDGKKTTTKQPITQLTEVAGLIPSILREQGVETSEISAIATRVLAPKNYFTENRVIDEEFMQHLDEAQDEMPLHVPATLAEIKAVQAVFPNLPIIAVSDTRFHRNKPDVIKYYTIDKALCDKYEIYKFGYHGISVSAATRIITETYGLPAKMIICHIGSGASVSAIENGVSIDNSMGYTPLDGVMMATRTGTLLPSALIALQRSLGLDCNSLEKFLNKESGLRGVGGDDDQRVIIKRMNEGDENATLAYNMYVERLQEEIGRSSAVLGGVDALVFTATIGERAADIRENVLQKLGYLGFSLDPAKNAAGLNGEKTVNLAATGSKPIYIVKTDEAGEIALQASLLENAA